MCILLGLLAVYALDYLHVSKYKQWHNNNLDQRVLCRYLTFNNLTTHQSQYLKKNEIIFMRILVTWLVSTRVRVVEFSHVLNKKAYSRCGRVVNQIKKGLLQSLSENIFKIGEHLAKLQARTWSSRALAPSFSSVLAKRTRARDIGWCRIGEISDQWLTEGSRELIPETRGSILEGTICYS